MPSEAIALIVHLATLCSPAARPMLAEILYDPSGADAGLEFVELFNPLDLPVPLASLRLEAGDGSGPNRWTMRWTGAAGDTIAARGRFVIGGASVVPAPAAIATLDLQNGPDAVRLVWPDGAVEVLGYGALDLAEYACGEPAADAPSGQSLARLPDDADSGSNALDFRPATPSPGRANRARRDVMPVVGSLALVPAQPAPETVARLAMAIANHGLEPIPSGALRVTARTFGDFGERLVADATHDFELEPGDTLAFETGTGPLPEGKQTLVVRVAVEGDEAPQNDADSLRVRVGPGPLELTEIQFHPARDEGEWVEVKNRALAAVALATFTLSDRGATRGRTRSPAALLPPDSLAVLAQDRAALLRHFPGLDTARVVQMSPWPALNNSNDGSGTADAVVLREEDGTPCARVDYSAAGVPAGTPLELGASDLWAPARDPSGSPLAPPRSLAVIGGRFEVAPRRLARSSGTTRLSWSLPWPRARVNAELFALSGARVGVVLPEMLVPGRGERDWKAEALGPGLYLLVFHARPDGGGEPLSVTRVIRIEDAVR